MDSAMAFAAEKEWLVDYVIQFLKSPSWTEPIEEFISHKCTLFDLSDPEENKLEYTGLHNEFKQIIESLLAAHLLQVDVTPDEFAAVFDACCSVDARLEQVAAQLASVDDFVVFKKMMAGRYKHYFGAFAFEQNQHAVVDEPTAAGQPQAELDARQHTQQVLSLLYQRQSEAAVATAEAESKTAAAAPETSSIDNGAENDALPPMPEMVTSAVPTAPRSSTASLPNISASRIAAIVAGAARAKTGDKEKAALVNLAGNSKIALVRGGGC